MKERTGNIRVFAAAAALAVAAAAFCGTALASDKEEGTEGTHIVTDHNGNEVAVPDNAERIVVCDIYPLPSVLTVFFDSADKIVGMAQPSMTAAQNGLLGELYPELLDAQTGFIDGSDINMEELLKLEPDVVFYSASNPAQGEQLANAGLAAVAVSVNKWDYNCIETLNHWIELLGEIFPENEKTQIVEEYSNRVYDMVQERVADIPEEERERMFVLFQYNETTLLTSGKQFFGQWWADAIGAVNVAEELTKDNSVAVNMEQIYAWNPGLIFITNFNTYRPEDLYENTVEGYDWSAVDAVVNKRAYKMPLGMYRSYTPGADTPVTLLWMAQTAYPELFEDIDIIAEAKTYYKDVFGIELTDEQAASIFAPSLDAGTGFAYNN
ncbi:MAG: ABC transporter substrate-binding protein [Lachnospiraceae bacterium]|nr:ABC transporter substrate-binding protein [Lachnospiraceae bacterium]